MSGSGCGVLARERVGGHQCGWAGRARRAHGSEEVVHGVKMSHRRYCKAAELPSRHKVMPDRAANSHRQHPAEFDCAEGHSGQLSRRWVLAAAALLVVSVCGAQGSWAAVSRMIRPHRFRAARWHFGTNGRIGPGVVAQTTPIDQSQRVPARVTRIDVERNSTASSSWKRGGVRLSVAYVPSGEMELTMRKF